MADSIPNESHAPKDNEATNQSAGSGYEKAHENNPQGIGCVFSPRLDEYRLPIEFGNESFSLHTDAFPKP
tara:strand:- start:249 stop:458 length:210 start_codon:yes stop_codon:yes gene_type:complete